MRLPRRRKSNLSPPDPAKLDLMQRAAMDTLEGRTGALIWNEHEGFQFRFDTDAVGGMSDGVYLLFLCYMRLSMDGDGFEDDMIQWAKRHQH